MRNNNNNDNHYDSYYGDVYYSDGYNGRYDQSNRYNQNNSYNQNSRYNNYGNGSSYNNQPYGAGLNQTFTQDSSYTFARYMAKTYLWMFFGLAITFGLALYMTLNSESVADFVLNHYSMYIGASIASLVFVIILGFIVSKLPPLAAKIIFILYSADVGILITPVLLAYSFSSVISAFAVTSGIYLVLAVIGIITKRDISRLGYILSITLIVTLLYSAISYFFIHSSLNDLIINAVVILVFMGFTVYDNYRIKKEFYAIQNSGNTALLEKASILSALSIYLDYINIFLRILALFGKKR